MCPSFQATRDEKDSTRGRANLLRLAITGQLGFDGLHRPARPRGARPLPRMQGLQGRVPDQRRHGPAQGRVPPPVSSASTACRCATGVFGHVAELGRIGGALAPLSNWLARSGLARLAEREAAGDRPPPHAAGLRAAVADAAFRGRERASGEPSARTEPRPPSDMRGPALPRHVHQLLRARGRRGGDRAAPAGRPGGHARAAGPALLRTAARSPTACSTRPWPTRGTTSSCSMTGRAQGRPIVACEPSCILTIRDDYPALLERRAAHQGRVGRRAPA